MKQVRVNSAEVKIIQAMAEKHFYATLEKIPVKPFYQGKVLMVEAPETFLTQLGF